MTTRNADALSTSGLQTASDGALQSTARGEDITHWLQDALHLLDQYEHYAEEMRTIGRGYSPTGLRGHSAHSIRLALSAIIEARG